MSFFRLCLRLLLFASLRTIVIRTLNDLYDLYDPCMVVFVHILRKVAVKNRNSK